MNQSSGKKNSVWIWVGIAAIIIIILFAIWQFGKGNENTNTTSKLPEGSANEENTETQPTADEMMMGNSSNTGTTTTTTTSGTSSTGATSSQYADGTYSAVGYYFEPEGQEQVNVSVTLKNGVVIASTFSGTPTDSTAQRMMMQFDAGYQNYVVGQPIDQINLSVVNGSSLTPMGFMDALQKIKSQAAQA